MQAPAVPPDTQIGNGVQLQQVEQGFTQGDIQTTGNSLDLALSGNGFFTMSQGGALQYTRGGLVPDQQQRLFVVKPRVRICRYTHRMQMDYLLIRRVDEPAQIPTGESAPAASTTGTLDFNLPANATPPAVVPGGFTPANASTYNQSTSTNTLRFTGRCAHCQFLFRQHRAQRVGCLRVYRWHSGQRRQAGCTHLQYQRGAHRCHRRCGRHQSGCDQLWQLHADDRRGGDEHHLQPGGCYGQLR